MPAPDPPEFRRRAVDLARAGDKPVSSAAAYFARQNTLPKFSPLVRELADHGFEVAVTRRVLGVRRQGYYEWRSAHKSVRAVENELLLQHIEGNPEEPTGRRACTPSSRVGSGRWSTTSGSPG